MLYPWGRVGILISGNISTVDVPRRHATTPARSFETGGRLQNPKYVPTRMCTFTCSYTACTRRACVQLLLLLLFDYKEIVFQKRD